MATTLHENNPVPSNGVAVASVNGGHQITMDIEGAGDISAEAQLWTRENGGQPGKAGPVQVISGTDSETKIVTIETNAIELWLQLISITPGALFSATLVEVPSSDGIPTAELADILLTEPIVGSRARAVDYLGSYLEYTEDGWFGFLGTFATDLALEAVVKTNLAAGCSANILDVGFAILPVAKTAWLVAEATAPD